MRRFLLGLLLAGVAGGPFKIGARAAEPEPILNWNPLRLPEPGETRLRVLSPTILELFTVFAHPPETDVPPVWQDLSRGKERPAASLFHAQAEGRRFEVKRVGFRRRAIYAPLKNYDLRVGRSIYLQLAEPLPPSGTVALSGPGPVEGAQCRYGPERWSPAIHVNQVGYAPEAPKQAQVGGFLGDLGELSIPEYRFNLIDEADGSAVFHGILQRRFEKGFRFPCYEKVFAADFSEFRKPGVYRLEVPGLGRSLPFRIDEGAVAAFARTYALGFYHQRCGDVNELPFTRFTHAPCHSKPAEVPTDAPEFQAVEGALAGMTSDVVRDKNHHTERLNKIANALFPFIRPGPVDVSGGHHDAGDYGKYTINSAQLIHYLVFAADAFPGAGGLDNLGLPESGDGKSDLLQIAKREADFLAKMQDKDGAFYFLVYPRNRSYESDVLPDHGDPQVVFPKNSSATAAATAALAQIGSSKLFQEQYPEEAARFLRSAKRGWSFLKHAWAERGRKGAYQKISHYGSVFGDDDEVAWAETEIFLATGDESAHRRLIADYKPEDPKNRLWTWWRLYEAYGCAARSYAFAVETGRAVPAKLDSEHLQACRNEVVARGRDVLSYSRESAYSVSFPQENKQNRNAGWFFANDAAFDLTAAYQIDRDPGYVDAVFGNLNYEGGSNPSNVTFITGLGWIRQREIVHQYAQNDERTLPPSGFPLGAVQEGFSWINNEYGRALGWLSYPEDGDEKSPYPFYDRWGDAFNPTTEFTVVALARSLGSLSYWMARTPAAAQPWKAASAEIAGERDAMSLRSEGLDLTDAQIVWEADGSEPSFGPSASFPKTVRWVEAEAVAPDGRRVFARREFGRKRVEPGEAAH